MRFVGHTMGTPGMPPDEAVRLFARLGLDAMELVCREGTGFAPDVQDVDAKSLAELARRLGCPVLTLTPYAWDFNSADPAKAAADSQLLGRAIDLAKLMNAPFVRAYGGRPGPDSEPVGAAVARAAERLGRIGLYAAERGVTLLVENHPGTLTRTGLATRDLVATVGLPSVRALYDPANVLHDTTEPWAETLELQRGLIAYVHVKDYRLENGKRRACCVGEGVVPWRDILAGLKAMGYTGPLSFEYEKRWYPDDLPDAAVGVPQCLACVKELLGQG